MRARIALVIEEALLAKVDVIAVEKHKRSTVIETAIREYLAREEKKEVKSPGKEAVIEKKASGAK